MVTDLVIARIRIKTLSFKKSAVILFIVIFSNLSYSQKSFKIVKTTWIYEVPKGFDVTRRGLKDKIQSGEDYLERTSEHQASNDDVILLSLVKNDSSEVNRVLASYKSNINIKNSSLRSYALKLGEFFEENTRNDILQSQTSVEVTEHYISNILFYCITKKITFLENNYTYYSQFYLSEIDEKEFSIVAIYDNDVDGLIITKSIINSIFK